MKKTVIALSALLASPIPVSAQDWAVDMAQSSLTFIADQGGAEFTGTIGSFDAQITFDPDDLSKTNILIDMDIASISTGDATRDGAMPGSDWFGTSAHPNAQFVATQAHADGDGAFVLEGTLSIKGVSKDIEFPFTLKIDGATAHAQGSLDIIRTDYNVGEGDFASEQVAGHSVTININIVAEKSD